MKIKKGKGLTYHIQQDLYIRILQPSITKEELMDILGFSDKAIKLKKKKK